MNTGITVDITQARYRLIEGDAHNMRVFKHALRTLAHQVGTKNDVTLRVLDDTGSVVELETKIDLTE